MIIREGIIKQAQELVLFLAGWFFPKECVGCGAEGAWLCATCRQQISWQARQTCLVCDQETDGKICSRHGWSLDGLRAATDYHDPLVEGLIKICKYHFSQEAAKDLSTLLWQFWQKHNYRLPAEAILVPVPLSRRRLRWRGFNQATILATNLATNLQLVCRDQSLVKIKDTRPQASLLAHDRLGNLRDCFVWRGETLIGQTVFVLDDVATTGATLNECAKVLKQAGAKRVWGIVVAK